MASYSQAVLAGLDLKGISLQKVRRGTGIPAARLAAASKGKRELTLAQLGEIETLSGFTAGQLAASITEPHGGPLTDLINGWAELHQLVVAHSQPSRAKRRPAKRRRKLAHAR
jgi:hypothetical protein